MQAAKVKSWRKENEVREDVVRLIYLYLGKHEFFSAFHCQEIKSTLLAERLSCLHIQ